MPSTANDELFVEFDQNALPYLRVFAAKHGLSLEDALSKIVADGLAEDFKRSRKQSAEVLPFRRK